MLQMPVRGQCEKPVGGEAERPGVLTGAVVGIPNFPDKTKKK